MYIPRLWQNQIIAIDLGTVNTVAVKDGKVVAEEPTLLVHNRLSKENFYGAEALSKVDLSIQDPKEKGNMAAIWPMVEGKVTNFDAVEEILSYILYKVQGKAYFKKLRVKLLVIAIPCKLSQLHKAAVVRIGKRFASDVQLIEQPVAAAIKEVDFTVRRSILVIDIGGGTTDIVAMSEDGVIGEEGWSLPVAGNHMDEKIKNYVKRTYHVEISRLRAQQIKHSIGCVSQNSENYYVELEGYKANGEKKPFVITNQELREILEDFSVSIFDAMRTAFADLAIRYPGVTTSLLGSYDLNGNQIQPEDNSILLTGGGSMLAGFDELMSREMGVRIQNAQNKLHGAALGAWKAADDHKLLDKYKVKIREWENGIQDIAFKPSPNSAPVAVPASAVQQETV